MRKYIFLYSLFYLSIAKAIIDLSLNYSENKQQFIDQGLVDAGVDQETSSSFSTRKTSNITLVWYIWNTTAIEGFYENTTQEVVDKRVSLVSSNDVRINSLVSSMNTQTSGFGLRQAFAPPKSFFTPSISIGTSRLVTSGKTTYNLTVSGVDDKIENNIAQESFTSGYAGISIRLRFSQRFGITLSARSVMPNFDWSTMNENLTYSVGLSLIL